MNKIVLSLLACVLFLSAGAQNNPAPSQPSSRQQKKAAKRDRINALLKQEEEGEMIFNKHSIFGIKLATDGYGLTYEIGKFKSPRKALLYQIELSEKKHPKEEKIPASANQFVVNSVVYGKLNNFYQLKLGIAQQRVIGGKGNKNGVAVSATYGGGLTLGLVKPYYVEVENSQRQKLRRTYATIIDSGYIEEKASGITVGWGDMNVRPGVYARTAMRFDYGRLNDMVTAIEVGLGAEFYSYKIPQLYFNKEKRFFFSAYVTLLLGKRK